MKNFGFALLTLIVVSQTNLAHAEEARDCRRTFANDVLACVSNSSTLPGKARSKTMKFCVAAARDERKSCLNPDPGPSQCELSCQATYDSSVNTCNTTYDPAVCGGYGPCEDYYNQQRAACTADATSALSTCNQSCP